jgi:hypothetical protein
MSLTVEEWSQIETLVGDVVNGISSRDALIYQIKRLRLQYGELPILLSTEADFIDPIESRLSLYKRAVELSQNPLDVSCLTQSAESLVEIYIEELSDYDNGLIWLTKLQEFVSSYGSDRILNSLSELEAKLKRLKIERA